MGSFGERLRREREMRGISLEDIAGATKIGTRLLRALEEEHFELLPGGIFNKGFVRAYAKYLGLNEDEAVANYLLAAGEASLDPKVIAEQNDSRIDRSGSDSGSSQATGFPVIPVLILLIVIAAGLGGWRIYQDRVRQRQAKSEAPSGLVTPVVRPVETTTVVSNTGAVNSGSGQVAPSTSGTAGTKNLPGTTLPGSNTANPETKSAASVGSSGTNGNSQLGLGEPKPLEKSTSAVLGATNPPSTPANANAAADQPFEVTVLAKDNAWVSIKSDGKIAVRGIIAPPDVKTVHATGQVVLWTGNAGAVEVSFNGQRIPLEGGPNTAGTLVFNSHGVVIPKPSAPTREP